MEVSGNGKRLDQLTPKAAQNPKAAK